MCYNIIGFLFIFIFFIFCSKCASECTGGNSLSQSCDKCGVCRRQRGTDTLVCDRSYLTTSTGLYTIDPLTGKCALRSFCTPQICRAYKYSVGTCIPLLGSYLCPCRFGYIGHQCQFNYKKSSYHMDFNYAEMNNVIFTPIFVSSQHAKIYITIMTQGINLKVKLNNGRRETLVYNDNYCKSFKRADILRVCKSIFYQVNDIKQCLGRILGLPSSWYSGCLMEINMPYPQLSHDSKHFIYEYINGDKTNSSVLGKIETVSLEVYNYNPSPIKIFQQTFSMINLYDTDRASSVSSCVPKVSLLECGAGMDDMSEYLRFRAFILRSSILMDELDTKCKSLERLKSKWKIWSIAENHDELEDPPLVEESGESFLVIREDTLDYGVYKAKLTVTAVYPHELIPGTGYCYFKIERIPVQTIIMGGSYRKIHYTHDMLFQVFSQLVPNRYTPSEKVQFVYTWSCQENDAFCAPFETKETSRLIPGPFRPSIKYVFTLSVKSKEVYSEQTTTERSEVQVIETTSDSTLDFSIRCLMNCGGFVFKSNPLEIVHLEVLFNETLLTRLALLTSLNINSGPFKWYYSQGLANTSGSVEVLGDMKRTPTENNVLVVNNGTLSYNETYVFFAFSAEFAKYELQTSTLPTNVTCTISPTGGIQGETYFNIYCTYNKTSADDILLMYEFNDKASVDERKRILGYSTTGKLERTFLVGDSVIVHVINIYGSLYEYQIKVDLKPPSQNLTIKDLHNKISNRLVGNYFYRLDKLSCLGDLLEEQGILDEGVDLLLDALVMEPFVTFQGALHMENTLYHVVCEDKDSANKFKSKTVFNLAKLMYRISVVLKQYTVNYNKTSRLWITRRIMDVADSILQCGHRVLDATKDEDDLGPSDFDYLKTSAFYMTNALNNLATVVSFHLLPSLLEVNFERQFIKVTLSIVPPLNSVVPPAAVEESQCNGCRRKIMGFFMILLVYKINPYWWNNGRTINTDVKYFRFFHGSLMMPTYQLNYTFSLDLEVNKFNTTSVQGFVRQPDPKHGPQVNDIVVAVHRVAAETNTVIFINFTDIGNHTDLRLAVLLNQRPDYDYMLNWSTAVKESQKIEFRNAEVHNNSFVYVGILPGASVDVGSTVNYSFELYSASCRVWRYESWMTGPLCQVDSRSNHTQLVCGCRQLPQTIAGQLRVPLNDLNPFSDIPLLIDITDYPFVSVFLVCNLVFYTVVMIWTRRKDREDEQHIYAIVLEDNDMRDEFGYLVGVFTGWRIGAGTTSNVGLRLIGEEGISRPHVLHCGTRRVLSANSDDWFLIVTPHHLGPLIRVSLWTDYSGSSPNWYCSKLFVCDLTRYETDTFFVEQWFGVTTEDIRLRVTREGATYNEINNTVRIISENLVYGFREQHLLLSVFCRHPRALGTRTQRWTVSYSGFFVNMATAAFLYYITKPEIEDIPFFSITKESVIVGLLSYVVGSTMSLYTIHYFKGCYRFVEGPPEFHNHSDCGRMYHFERQTSENQENPPNWLKVLGKSVIKYFKPWNLIPVQSKEPELIGVKTLDNKIFYCWLFCIITFFVSWNITVVESIHFGSTKSQYCFSSVIMSVILVCLITSPVKVLVSSCLMAISKTRLFKIIPHSIGFKNILENFKLRSSAEHRDYLYMRRSLPMYHPPSLFEVFQLEPKRNRIIAKWICIYSLFCIIFLAILVVLIHSFEIYSFSLANFILCSKLISPELCQSTKNNIEISNMRNFMVILEMDIFPLLYTLKWYNGDNLTQAGEGFAETGWVEGGTVRLLGVPRIRQLRVRHQLCPVPSQLVNLSISCQAAQITESTEDRGQYSTGWTSDNWTDSLFEQSPWRFRSPADDERGADLRVPSGYWAHSGGYIVSLGRSLPEATRVMRYIQDTSWVDKYTRVTIAGFTVYNANKDMFTVTYSISEALPVGLLVLGYRIATIKLSPTIHTIGICFILFFIVATTRFFAFMNVYGFKNSITNFWVVLELFMFAVYIITLFLYINYLLDGMLWLEKLQKQGKDVLYNLYVLTNRQYVLRDSVGVLFWLAAFRILRIVRFNNDVRQYIHDLSAAKYDMFWTMTALVLCMFIQFRIFFLVASPPFKSFKNILSFTSDFKYIIDQYKNVAGKLLAYLLGMTANIGMFSFVLSFTHYYKQRLMMRRLSTEMSSSKHKRRTRLTFD